MSITCIYAKCNTELNLINPIKISIMKNFNHIRILKSGLILAQICFVFASQQGFAQQAKKTTPNTQANVQGVFGMEKSSGHSLVSCKANYSQKQVVMNWTLSGSTDEFEKYWVERSKDKENFDLLGAGGNRKENGGQVSSFSFVDKNPGKGVTYYRILCLENKQIKMIGDMIQVTTNDSDLSFDQGNVPAQNKMLGAIQSN